MLQPCSRDVRGKFGHHVHDEHRVFCIVCTTCSADCGSTCCLGRPHTTALRKLFALGMSFVFSLLRVERRRNSADTSKRAGGGVPQTQSLGW